MRKETTISSNSVAKIRKVSETGPGLKFLEFLFAEAQMADETRR